MNPKPTITIFMAVYNGGRYLKEAIDSVLAQSYEDFELLIINDGSTDNTLEIISQYSDTRIRVLKNEGNKGLVYTRSRGVEEARGEYFAILDCDDVAMPERLQIQLDFFIRHPEIALCSGRAINIGETGTPLNETDRFKGDKNVLLLFGNILVNSAVMIRTKVIRDVGSYQANAPAEDYDLAMRIAADYPVATIDDILVMYRVHGSNTSRQSLEHQKRMEKNIFRDFHSRFKIKTSERKVDLHHSFLSGQTDGFSLDEYHSYILELWNNSNITAHYKEPELRKVLFNKWFDVVMIKGGRKAMLLLFNTPLYSSAVVSSKHLRRAFKKSLKSFLSRKG